MGDSWRFGGEERGGEGRRGDGNGDGDRERERRGMRKRRVISVNMDAGFGGFWILSVVFVF